MKKIRTLLFKAEKEFRRYIVSPFELAVQTFSIGIYAVLLLVEYAWLPVVITELRSGPFPGTDIVEIAFWGFPFAQLSLMLIGTLSMGMWSLFKIHDLARFLNGQSSTLKLLEEYEEAKDIPPGIFSQGGLG